MANQRKWNWLRCFCNATYRDIFRRCAQLGVQNFPWKCKTLAILFILFFIYYSTYILSIFYFCSTLSIQHQQKIQIRRLRLLYTYKMISSKRNWMFEIVKDEIMDLTLVPPEDVLRESIQKINKKWCWHWSLETFYLIWYWTRFFTFLFSLLPWTNNCCV